MTAREELLRRVRHTRTRALRQGLARTVLAGLAGVGLVFPASALVPWARVAPGLRPGLLAGFTVLALAAGAALAVGEWRRARPRLSWAQAADLLASLAPPLRAAILTGADLASWEEGGAEARGASDTLAAAQVERAAGAAAGLTAGRALPLARVGPALGAACAVALLVAAWAWYNPNGSAAAWKALAAPKPVGALTVANLRLTCEPPLYTALPRTVLEGVSGAVEALRGTRVTLEGALSAPVDGGRWESSEGRPVALEVRGKTFRVSWVLDRAGTYDLAFERGGRAVPSNFTPQPQTLRPDERPRVELAAPAKDVETAADQEVRVEFSAADDFRVDRADLVLQGETEVRVPVRLTPGAAVTGTARFLALAYPKLGAGAHLHVEAWDSDNVSGPKAGISRSVYLSFLDRRRLLEDIRVLQERLFEALLSHLADHLETPGRAALAALRARGADLLTLFGSLLARVHQAAQPESPAAAALVKIEASLRAVLAPFAAGAGDQAAVTGELERDVLFLDRLLRNLQMEETLTLGDDLVALQRSLFDELQAGRAPKDLVEQVARLEQLLKKMREKLSKGEGEMPDSFVNSDAVKDMPSSELDQQFKQLKKALQEGKTAEARKLAEKLLETLGRWMKSLQDAAERAAGTDLDPASKELAKLEAEVEGLVGDQEHVLQETRAAGDEPSRRAADGVRRELASLLGRLDQRLNAVADLARRTEALAQRAPSHAPSGSSSPPSENRPNPLDLFEAAGRVSSALSETRQALRSDLAKARSGAQAALDSFGALRKTVDDSLAPDDGRRDQAKTNEGAAGRELQAFLQELDNLDQRRLKALSPRESQAVKNLGGEQGRLAGRTGELAEKLEELARRTPFLGPGLPGRARSAQGRMGQAGERLGQGNPFGAVPPEGQALEELSGIAQALGEARRQALPGGKGGSGFSLMRQPSGGQGREGGREVDRGHVDIPKEAEAKELKAFREEVMKAMRRGGYPRNFEEEVERYYERLIR